MSKREGSVSVNYVQHWIDRARMAEELNDILVKYIDRLSDPVDSDPLERSVAELLDEVREYMND